MSVNAGFLYMLADEYAVYTWPAGPTADTESHKVTPLAVQLAG